MFQTTNQSLEIGSTNFYGPTIDFHGMLDVTALGIWVTSESMGIIVPKQRVKKWMF